MRAFLRGVGLFVLVAFGLAGVVWVSGWVAQWAVSDRLYDEAPAPPKLLVEQAEHDRDVEAGFERDPAKRFALYRDEPVKPAGESPLLADLVKGGKLPPLSERAPPDPVVMQGADGVGNYGGTWLRLVNSDAEVPQTLTWRLSCSTLLRWSPLGYPIKPFIAKSVTTSDGGKTWTIKLRPGLKWSDGEPYTADDLIYWWRDEVLNPVVGGTPPEWMMTAGQPGTMEKVSDYEVRVTFELPNALYAEYLATRVDSVGSPAHYLRKFHPDPRIGDALTIEHYKQAYNQVSATALYAYMKHWQNTQMPRLWPWIYRGYRTGSPQVFVRNPYYFAVDTAGNQLPYLDRVQFEVKSPQLMAIAVADGPRRGGSTMQDRNVNFSDYTEFMTRRWEAGTRVLHWYPGSRQVWVINPNCNKLIDPRDPSTGKKERLLSDKRFRQAMSIAINRKQIIRAEYFDIGEPSQVSPGPMSRFDNPDLARKYTQYDPAQANKVLDELGLTKRDYEGYRTFPDGSRMTFLLHYSPVTGRGPAQFVLDDWKGVGVRVVMQELPRNLMYAYKDAREFDFIVWSSESDFEPLLCPRYFVAVNAECFYAPGWGRWYARGGLYGAKQSREPGSVSPEGTPMYDAMTLYDEALHTEDPEEQVELFRKVQAIAAENVWSIGIATAPPSLVVIDRNLKNVPERAITGAYWSTPGNTGMETYFFENVAQNEDADAALKASLVLATLRPAVAGAAEVGDSFLDWLWTIGWLGVIALVLVLLWLRHPYILRRLALMVPTLLLISVVVFTVIQAPPGDYVSHQVAELEAIGDPAAQRKIQDLNELFNRGDPMWLDYCRWMGIEWFFTLEPGDKGLLQGHLGVSMEKLQPVNEIVGNRIMMTLLLSVGALIFTWVLAFPLGIYSAVRQRTAVDYALTFLALVAMSVPAFLLGLFLVAFAGDSGLFSPQFAAQSHWTLAKIWDLAKHLWIPVVVLGAASTAGMMRVIRANLLDELRKPYVVAARARGLPTWRLILKYPVRLAINPSVSVIGHLFPDLISGGAIVSYVLALPMLGPLMLDALANQDVYLAGSLLMIMSVLGVVGTLVSDLLLLWLDPRIRLEGVRK